MVHARGDVQVHRPARRRHGAPVHLRDGREVRHHEPEPAGTARQRGFTVISGLAWSGRGRVRRVDVSLDGGRNWRDARIDGLVLDKACVRFYAELDWNGEELLLQSRAIDETGYVQPARRSCGNPRGELDLSQQRHPDLARARKRGGRECRSRLNWSPPRRCSLAPSPRPRWRRENGRQIRPALQDRPRADRGRNPRLGYRCAAGWPGLAPEGKGSVAQGEKLFMDNCSTCHGEFGEGKARTGLK